MLGVSRALVLVVGTAIIPLGLLLHGMILDTAYITYAIRGAAAVAVVLGIYWTRNNSPVPTSASVNAAMIASTSAAITFAIFEKSIAEFLGFTVDKVFAALFFSLTCILLITFIARTIKKRGMRIS